MTTIATNIQTIQQQIRHFEFQHQRPVNSVSLLAVSKTQSIEKIREAIQAGQLAFGENYLQEALEKITALNNPNIEWHFIGPIQSNKTKKIAEHFHWVQSVSDIKIAKRLNDQRPESLPPLSICLQVNISHEKTKSGVHPDEVFQLATECITLPRLIVRGLMAIPSATEDFQKQRDEFKKLRLLAEKLKEKGFDLDTLSMGMSHDMEAAVAEGSTMVRIGTNIFGQRQKA